MRFVLLLLVLALAACAESAYVLPATAPLIDPSPFATATTPPPTATAISEAPPSLVEPASDAHRHISGGVWMAWTWHRYLQPGEYFEILVSRPGGSPERALLSQSTAADVTDWFAVQPPGQFEWTVRVIREGQAGENSQPVSHLATAHLLEVDGMTGTPPATVTPTPSPTLTPEPTAAPVTEWIAPGFTLTLYATVGVGANAVITTGPDDCLYVMNTGGIITRLVDTDGDGYAEQAEVVFDDPHEELIHTVGMAFQPGTGTLYVSDSGRVSTVTDEDDDGALDTVTPVVEGLPSLKYVFHSNNGIAFGPDGKIYVGIGSSTDHGPASDNPLEGSIVRFDADGSNLEVFASGFRNPYDLLFTPGGDLFAGDNAPDVLDSTLRYMPPEELNHVRQGEHYGFPGTYGKLIPAGDTSQPALVEFFPSSVTAGMAFYDANQFPPAYRGGIFVAQNGTGLGSMVTRHMLNGFAIVFVDLEKLPDGSYSGDRKVFVQFNRAVDPAIRPIDVTVGPDGALYVTQLESGDIYRIAYTGAV